LTELTNGAILLPMGVSIPYRGRLNDVVQLDALREELANIAEAVLIWARQTIE